MAPQAELLMPIPDNLVQKGHRYVDSDLYNICERVKEISPRLRILHQPRRPDAPWIVFEQCTDGVERFVSRYSALDARILTDLRRMLAIPAKQRLAAAEKAVEEHNKKLSEAKTETEEFEKLAWGLQKSLVESNISRGAPVSRRKVSKKQRNGK